MSRGLVLETLRLDAAPGLPQGLPDLVLGPGLTLVLGENASGKSTSARVLRAMLWPGSAAAEDVATATWSDPEGQRTCRLFGGAVAWLPAAPAGVPAEAEGLVRLGLSDLLRSGSETDFDLARRFDRELAGGLDLASVRDSLALPERPRRPLTQALEAAEAALTRESTRAQRLHEREGRLAQHQKDAADLDLVAADREACLRQLELHSARVALDAVQAELDLLPDGMDALAGDEETRLADLERRRADLVAERDGAEAELARLRQAEEEDALPGREATETELAAWSEQLDGLRDRVNAREARLEDLAAAEAARDEARAGLTVEGAPAPTASELDGLASALGLVQRFGVEKLNLTSDRSRWQFWSEDGAEEDPDALRAALVGLRSWLRTPDETRPGGAGPPGWLSLALVLLGLVALTLGAVSLASLGPASLGSAGALVLGAVAVVLGLLLRRGQAPAAGGAEASRKVHRAQAERAGAAPATWEPRDVEAEVAGLEVRLAAAELAKRSGQRLQDIEQDLARCADEETAATDDLVRRLEALSLFPGFSDLGAIEQAQRLARLGEAEARTASARGALARLDAALADGLAAWRDWTAELGLEPDAGDDEPTGAVARARAARDALAGRVAARATRRAAMERAASDLARLDRELERVDAELGTFWDRLGLSASDPRARATLAEQVLALPTYRKLALRRANATAELGRARDRAEQAGVPRRLGDEAADPELDPTTLTDRVADHDRTLAGRDALNQEIGAIQEALREATEGESGADATATRRVALDALATEREEAVVAALGRELLEQARAAGGAVEGASSRFELAAERFARFTGGRWRLDVDADRGFLVHDTATGRDGGPAELSDGTRVQLLLAARLTGLEQLEPAGPVPIVLDEALSTTDSRRFPEIAGALLEAAAEGRQVLYLTADAAEAGQWLAAARELDHPEPRLVDLDALRGRAPAWGGELPPVPARPQALPDPTGCEPAAYARALGAPAPDGLDDPASWHLYVAAYDELGLLRSALEHRITTLGHWRELSSTGRVPEGLEPDAVARVDARVALARTLVARWRRGRGTRVTWPVVDASGAISPTYQDDVRELVRRHERDPRAFLAAVGDLRNFRIAKLEQLELHLTEAGCVPEGEPPEAGRLLEGSLSASPEAVEVLGVPAADAYLAWLLDLIETEPVPREAGTDADPPSGSSPGPEPQPDA